MFDAAAFRDATRASEQQMADMERYRSLLEDWNGRMNLVGPSALAEFWGRHAFDSAQLLGLEPEAKVWADIGAGAGFPGVVLAVFLKSGRGRKVHLIESMAKRCRFLQAVTDELALPAEVHNARAEDLKITGIEVVTARACAPLPRLFGYAWPFFRQGARGLFLKGRDVESELTDAAQTWRFQADLLPSLSDSSGRIVRVERLARA